MASGYRRQEMLREQAVARLYGEDAFREIVRQSETMPNGLPLGLGMGYVKGGDWAPARHELEHYVGERPPLLTRILQHPFLGRTSLADLREALADNAKTMRLRMDLMSEFGGFSGRDALINEATVNGKVDANRWFDKVSNTTTANAAYWAWMWAGQPGAGVIPAASVASTATSATTAGAFGQGNAPASNTKHLVSAWAASTIAAGTLILADMTLIVQPILATTTAQTITGSPSRYQSNGNNGVYPFVFCGGTLQSQAAWNATLTYTESTAGTTGKTTGALTGFVNTPAYRTMLNSGQLFLPLAAGDVGVRRLETTTWSVAASQAAAWGLAYPYCAIPITTANAVFGVDLLNTAFSLPQIIDGACLMFFLLAATTTSGLISGELVLVSGNS